MAEQLSIPPALGIPTRVGRYRVLCELGTGSMASLYLGRAGGLGGFERLFALKVVHPHLCRRPAFIEMFLNEARIAASVHHPNVVPVYEVDVDAGQYFLAMDYVSGETLALLLRSTWNMKRSLPIRIATHIVASAAEGLHAAHELTDASGASRNVVHRDVAPQNIMIGYDGIVRVTDFGIAKAMDTVSQTKPGVLKGTVAYMSPEQVRGLELDRRVDVFALGVLLWEATTGLRLFKDSTDIRTAGRILKMNVPPPSTMADDYPEGLDAIVMKALAKDREERYQSARELSEDLFSFLATEERVTASEMERYIKEIFAERLKQRRALERDAADPEPPEDIGDHLSDASQTLGLEHFTAHEAWEAIDSDELEVLGPTRHPESADVSAALRETAAIEERFTGEGPDTEADRPRGLPRNVVEKIHATTSKMPLPGFSEEPSKAVTPASVLPSGRVAVKVGPETGDERAKKKPILPPFDRTKRATKARTDALTEASIGDALVTALAVAPPDAAGDGPTLDEDPKDAAPDAADASDAIGAAMDALFDDADAASAAPEAPEDGDPAEISAAPDDEATQAPQVKSDHGASDLIGEAAGEPRAPLAEDDETTVNAGASTAASEETSEAAPRDDETTVNEGAPAATAVFVNAPKGPPIEAPSPVPEKFSQRNVQTAVIRDTGPILLARPSADRDEAKIVPREVTAVVNEADVIETLAEDTQRVANPLLASVDDAPEPDAEDDDGLEAYVFAAGSEPDASFEGIAAEEQKARRVRVVGLAVAASMLIGIVVVLWPSAEPRAPIAATATAAEEAEGDEEAPEPELVAPKPREAAAPTTVSLRVEVTPADAKVLLDGRPYSGPVEVARAAGEDHVVRVVAPGYEPQMVVVTGAEDRVVRVALVPKPAAAVAPPAEEPPEPKAEPKRRRRRARKEAKKRTRRTKDTILFDGDDL